MCERMNWKIPKTHGSRKKRSNQGFVVEETALLSQVGQVVNLGSHKHLSSQTFTMVDSWGSFFFLGGGSFFPVLFGATSPLSSYLDALQPFLSEGRVVLFSSHLGNSKDKKWM